MKPTARNFHKRVSLHILGDWQTSSWSKQMKPWRDVRIQWSLLGFGALLWLLFLIYKKKHFFKSFVHVGGTKRNSYHVRWWPAVWSFDMLLHVHQKVSGLISIPLKINNILVVKLYINIKYWYTEIQILVLYLNKQHTALTYTLK